VHIDDNAFRLCSGLGGGMGHARDVCGALVGCIMVISTLVGRNKPNEKPLKEIYPYSKEFHDRFVQAFGSSACKDLMHFEFDTREHLSWLLKAERIKSVSCLAEFLEEKKLVPGSNL
jgi:C_GCAxxG_C_C family probable redox protein